LGHVYLYLELEEPDSAEIALNRFKPFLEAYKVDDLPGMVYTAEGRIAEFREEFEEAIESFEKMIEFVPWSVRPYWLIGRCYRKLGELERAEEALEKVLKLYKMDPDCLYELALVYHEKGEIEKATKTLEKALSVWENAEPVYKPARMAREKLAEWTS
jgi:tetratricopeptide (TPR) repeat protein